MAASVLVEEKAVPIDCCFCFSSGISIKFKLDGLKCRSFGLQEKLEIFLGSQFTSSFEQLLIQNASVCRNCFRFIERIFSFRENCLCSAESYLGQNVKRLKRTPVSEGSDPPSNPTRMYTKITHTMPADRGCIVSEMGDNVSDISDGKTALSRDEQLYAIQAIERNKLQDLVSIPAIQQTSKHLLASEVSNQCLELSIRAGKNTSLLLKRKSIEELNSWQEMFHDISEEIRTRIPFLHYIMCVVGNGNLTNPNFKKVETTISMAYAILMFQRNCELSAIQRLLTVICMKGNLDDKAMTRLNQIGITMSPRSKFRILEECNKLNNEKLLIHIRDNPLIKITGHNLDIYVRTSMQGLDRQHKDMHMFASNVLSTRIANTDIDNTSIRNPIPLNATSLLLSGFNADILRMSYKILISRILSKEVTEYKWMEAVTPSHMPHPYMSEMSNRSFIFQLPLQLKNESKYEDCISIMNSYESTITKLFEEAHGNTDILDEYKVILGGDQLTRVRMEGAKDLKRLSTTMIGRLEHLEPLVCELWHLKQDFLEKLYKTFFGKVTASEPGTLFHLKTILKKADVNGKVKSNYKAHSEFLCLIVKEFIREQALEVMESCAPLIPANIKVATTDRKTVIRDQVIHKIMKMFGYNEGDTSFPNGDPDELFNYSCQLCQWGIHFLALNDTAKEGDIMRVQPNLLKCIPFFYSHSKLSKYLVECVDIILKCESSSPLCRTRILEGFFVNKRGGHGNNVEADLVQEHSVRHQKELIRALGANKSDKAILRATGAANLVTSLVENYDTALSVPIKGSNHSTSENEKDLNAIRECLRSIRPFKHTPGRKCPPHKFGQPKFKVKIDQLLIDLKVIIDRLSNGLIETQTHEEEDNVENEGLPDI